MVRTLFFNSFLKFFLAFSFGVTSTFCQDNFASFEQSLCYSSQAATLSSVLLRFPDEWVSEKVKVLGPESKKPLTFRVYPPTDPQIRRWLFIFTGIGTGVDDIHALKAARLLRNAGLQDGLVIIPSIFRMEFAASFSRLGVVGNIPEDVKDLAQAISHLKSQFLDKYYTISEISYFGFSLGALTAAHLAVQMKSQHLSNLHPLDKALKPKKIILLNSPINLLKSLQNIDKLNKAKVDIYQNSQIAMSYLGHLNQEPNQESLDSLLCGLKEVDSDSLSSVITDSLKFNLDDLFLYAQQRSPTGVLDQRPHRHIRSSRERDRIRRLYDRHQAKNLSFEKYVTETVLPLSGETQLKKLNQKVSITALSPEIQHNTAFYVIHTEDDFLQSNLKSNNEELQQYTSLFLPQNRWIKKKGGHLGLLNTLELGLKIKHFLN
jgi:hypothetical protein